MTAVAVLGVVADAVGIFQFVAEKFASKDDGSHAVVRVAAALDGGSDHLTNGGGGINSIRLYNENEEDIGDIGKRKIGNGEFQDFKIKQSSSQQAAYAAISATNDAICVPYVTMTWADGAKYGWIGDWGKACDLNWYYGNVYVDEDNYKPWCTWLDNDHTNDFKASTIYIHFPSFTDKYTEGKNQASYCGGNAFHAYGNDDFSDKLFKKDSIGPSPKDARPSTKVQRAADSRIVITSEATHNATALCESNTSWGPDLVSLEEKVYCNMETRETLPLCDEDITADCFHVESRKEKRQAGGGQDKQFAHAIYWD